jgi:hypothetical protein
MYILKLKYLSCRTLISSEVSTDCTNRTPAHLTSTVRKPRSLSQTSAEQRTVQTHVNGNTYVGLCSLVNYFLSLTRHSSHNIAITRDPTFSRGAENVDVGLLGVDWYVVDNISEEHTASICIPEYGGVTTQNTNINISRCIGCTTTASSWNRFRYGTSGTGV